jgi:hypothetical protein
VTEDRAGWLPGRSRDYCPTLHGVGDYHGLLGDIFEAAARPERNNVRRVALRTPLRLPRALRSIDHPAPAVQPRDLLLIHRRLPHHSALNQSALSTPIGDRNRSRFIGFRLASDDDHRDAALRTWGRGLQVARKLNNVVSQLTLPTARSRRRRLRVRETFLRLMTFPHKSGAALITK